MPSITEFERTKPVITMKKINTIIALINQQLSAANSREEVKFLNSLLDATNDMKNSFINGE